MKPLSSYVAHHRETIHPLPDEDRDTFEARVAARFNELGADGWSMEWPEEAESVTSDDGYLLVGTMNVCACCHGERAGRKRR